ncbi:MAG: MurT ligase domain-containing protein [Oscillospiraceae bacterium]|nr:MurT ligase domain-containing protein [Oscillospiraceae bacterium]
MCKFSRFAIRKLGRGGTDMPGRIALKICPDLLGRLAKDVTTVIVTGTNGKTTTSRMIEQAMTDSGISFFANKTGANLLSGVTAEFAANSGTLSGKCRYPYALIEADEAAFKAISTFVDAKTVVVTNVFRDQLDRYGEVTHTLDNIRIGISHSPNAVLCLNADDSLSGSLAGEVENPVIFYGVNTPIYEKRVEEVSDAPYCIKCKHEYVYDYVTYGHLGGYHCPHCGYGRPEPQVAVSQVRSSDAEQSQITFRLDGTEYPAVVNLPGGYNIYNAASCMAAGKAMGLNAATVAESLSRFQCGFGRMEKFDINGTSVRMILIKNPAGCNQVLNFLSNASGHAVFVACLNDRAQDGRDISWIWDVDFEKLLDMGEKLDAIYVSGVRADDMALRFKYAGIPPEKIFIEKDYVALMEKVTAQPQPVYVMPTYTAMLDLRDKISRTYGFKEYWEA